MAKFPFIASSAEMLSNYMASKSINQSLFTWIDMDPSKARKSSDDPQVEHLVVGSAADTILLTPDLFDSRFIISDELAKLDFTTATGLLIKDILEDYPTRDTLDMLLSMEDRFDIVLRYANDRDLWKNIKAPAKRLEQVGETNTVLWTYLKEFSDTKSIITQESANKIRIALEGFENSPRLHELFMNPDVKLFTQVPLYLNVPVFPTMFHHAYKKLDWTVATVVPVKALLDIVMVNEKTRTVHIFDVKTTDEDAINFGVPFRKYRYHVQIGHYFDMMNRWGSHYSTPGVARIPTEESSPFSDWFFESGAKNFQVSGFSLIVVNKSTGKTVLHPFTAAVCDRFYKGFIDRVTEREVPGAKQLLERLLWHALTEDWEYPAQCYDPIGVNNDLNKEYQLST